MSKDNITDSHIRKLQKIIQSYGIEVRRENLSRGGSFKVKSGQCLFVGKNLLFVDKRLSNEQQVSVLLDYLLENKLKIRNEDIEELPQGISKLINTRNLAA